MRSRPFYPFPRRHLWRPCTSPKRAFAPLYVRVAQSSHSDRNRGGSMLGKMSKVPAAYMRFVRVISFLFLISTALAQNGPTIPVNCDKGQSLNSTLSRLNRKMPTTILVQGTCTEYVRIDGFENLTLKGQPGAALQQPATNPQS